MKKIFSFVLVIVIGIVFEACAPTQPQSRISSVHQSIYPKGITVFIANSKIREGIEISDARLIYAQSKREVQLIVNNISDYTYNLLLSSEWTDDRGVKISAYPDTQRVSLNPNDGKRVVLEAPNFKGKNVLIKITCGQNCIAK